MKKTITNSLKIVAVLMLVFVIHSSFTTITGKRNSKESFVKITTDPSTAGTLYVSLSNDKNKNLQFFMFDLEGQLIENFLLDHSSTKKIDQLRKGIYMYDVFKNDESVERGSVEIK